MPDAPTAPTVSVALGFVVPIPTLDVAVVALITTPPVPTCKDGVVTIPAVTLTPWVSTMIPSLAVIIPIESTFFTLSLKIVPATEISPSKYATTSVVAVPDFGLPTY